MRTGVARKSCAPSPSLFSRSGAPLIGAVVFRRREDVPRLDDRMQNLSVRCGGEQSECRKYNAGHSFARRRKLAKTPKDVVEFKGRPAARAAYPLRQLFANTAIAALRVDS
jgi:hypothetical protein